MYPEVGFNPHNGSDSSTTPRNRGTLIAGAALGHTPLTFGRALHPAPSRPSLPRKAIQRCVPQAMPGKANAVKSGKDLEVSVSEVGVLLGLVVESQVAVGRRIWGARRQIDVVLKHPETRISLGIECKYQGTTGSAEEKIPATIEDIQAWPIRGIVVFSGEGFSENIKAYLLSTGKAVELCDLKKWLELYFGL